MLGVGWLALERVVITFLEGMRFLTTVKLKFFLGRILRFGRFFVIETTIGLICVCSDMIQRDVRIDPLCLSRLTLLREGRLRVSINLLHGFSSNKQALLTQFNN